MAIAPWATRIGEKESKKRLELIKLLEKFERKNPPQPPRRPPVFPQPQPVVVNPFRTTTGGVNPFRQPMVSGDVTAPFNQRLAGRVEQDITAANQRVLGNQQAQQRRQDVLRESFQTQQPLSEIIAGQVQAGRNIPAEEALRRISTELEKPPSPARFGERFGELAEKPVQLVPFASTVADFGELSAINRAANALEANEPMGEKELQLLQDYLVRAQRDTSWGYKVMDVLAQMPAFAGEIAATSGIYSGARAIGQKTGTAALKRLIGRAIEGKLAQVAIKGTAGAIAAGAAGVPAAAMRTPAGIQERQLTATLTGDEEEVWKSAVKAFGSAWVETASERTGGALGAATGPIKGQLMKSALLRSILRLNPSKTPSDVNKVFQKFGYNGVFGEMFEERVADVGHGILAELGLGDEPFRLPSLEQLSVELAAFAVPGVAANIAENAPFVLENIRRAPERGSTGFEKPIVSAGQGAMAFGSKAAPTPTPEDRAFFQKIVDDIGGAKSTEAVARYYPELIMGEQGDKFQSLMQKYNLPSDILKLHQRIIALVSQPKVPEGQVAKAGAKEPWMMSQKEFQNWEFTVPEGGASKTPKTVMSWKRGEDFETLADYANTPDREFEFNEILGKGWERGGVPNSLRLKDAIRKGDKIKVYRASDVGDIVPGSYVSESRKYVQDHGETRIPGGKFQVYELEVFPDELLVYGDPHEFIYVPRSVKEGHKRILQKALSEGKPVPAEVLKDYPDLAPPSAVRGVAPAAPAPAALVEAPAAEVGGAAPPVKPPEPPKVATVAPEPSGKPPKRTPIQNVRAFYKEKIADLKETTKIKTLSLKDWTDFTVAQRAKTYRENIDDIKAVTQDKVASLKDWNKYSLEEQHRVLSSFYNEKIADLKETSKIKALSLKDWTDYTAAERAKVYRENIADIKAATQDKVASLKDWNKYSLEEQHQVLSSFYNAKIADMEAATADKIASLKDWANYNVTERQRVKAILTDYINGKLPIRERGKLIAAVKNVNDQKGLDELLFRVDRMAEVTNQRRLKADIIKELKRAKPRKVEGIVKGRFGGDIQAELDIMNRTLKMTRDDALAKIQANQQAYESGMMSYEDMVTDNFRLNFTGIEGMTATELQETLDYITSLKEIGRAIRIEELEKWQEGIERAKTDISKVITGGKQVEPGVTKEFAGLRGLLKRIEGGQVALTDFLDILSGTDKSSKPYRSALNLFVDNRVLESYNAEQNGLVATGDTVRDNFNRIFGVEKDRAANDILRRLGKEKVNLGTFQNTEGKSVKLVLTKGQMIDAYNLMQAGENLPTFTEGNKFTQEMQDAISNGLTTQEKAWADWQRSFLADYWTGINGIYEPLYGVKLGRNENYWPRNRDIERSDVPEHILIQEDYNHFASVTNGSLKARTQNKIPFKFLDANTKLLNHVTQMEHFKAWANTIRDLRSVFMSRDIKNAIHQFYGREIANKIDDYISVLARGGIEKAKRVHILDTLRGNVAVAVLGIKPMIAIKQPLAMLAYATEMPYKDFVTGVGDFLKNPLANYKILYEKSASLRARYRAGQYERDIKVGVQGGVPTNLSGKANWKERVLTLIQLGDQFGTVPGMWAKYQSELKAGATDEQAILEAEKLTNRTQNTSQLFTLTTIQHGGSWARLLTMFQDQPNKYFRLLNSNFRNMVNGRQGVVKSVSNIALLWVVIPVLFQWMSDAFQWKPERQLRAAALGPVNMLLIFGQVAQSVVGWVTGEKYPYEPSPVLQIADDIQSAIRKMRKLITDGQDPLKDVSLDDVIDMVEYLAKAAGMAAGVPTPYAVQVEKALRGEVDKEGNRERDLRELLFSRWALEEPKPKLSDDVNWQPKDNSFSGSNDNWMPR